MIFAWSRLIPRTLLRVVIIETCLASRYLLSHQCYPGKKLRSSAACASRPGAHRDVQWENQCGPITNYENNGQLAEREERQSSVSLFVCVLLASTRQLPIFDCYEYVTGTHYHLITPDSLSTASLDQGNHILDQYTGSQTGERNAIL